MCGCGCNNTVTSRNGSRCKHCGNLALMDCFDDDVQDVCNICVQQMQMLNLNFSKVKKNVKLETTFKDVQGKLRILPDDTMVAFSLHTIDVKTRISLSKLKEWFKIYYAAESNNSDVKSMTMVKDVMRHIYFKGSYV